MIVWFEPANTFRRQTWGFVCKGVPTKDHFAEPKPQTLPWVFGQNRRFMTCNMSISYLWWTIHKYGLVMEQCPEKPLHFFHRQNDSAAGSTPFPWQYWQDKKRKNGRRSQKRSAPNDTCGWTYNESRSIGLVFYRDLVQVYAKSSLSWVRATSLLYLGDVILGEGLGQKITTRLSQDHGSWPWSWYVLPYPSKIHPCPKKTNKHWCISMISKMYRNSMELPRSEDLQEIQAPPAIPGARCARLGSVWVCWAGRSSWRPRGATAPGVPRSACCGAVKRRGCDWMTWR